MLVGLALVGTSFCCSHWSHQQSRGRQGTDRQLDALTQSWSRSEDWEWGTQIDSQITYWFYTYRYTRWSYSIQFCGGQQIEVEHFYNVNNSTQLNHSNIPLQSGQSYSKTTISQLNTKKLQSSTNTVHRQQSYFSIVLAECTLFILHSESIGFHWITE
jgi:hypothetical protein